MSQLNTLALRDALISRVTEFALDEHFVEDVALSSVIRDIWAGAPELGGLGSDLWVEGAFPSLSASETMEQIAQRGIISQALAEQLNRSGAFPINLAPYTHQLASLEAAHQARNSYDAQPALVITAGTGAGKTESFLFPLLDRLWTEAPTPGGGVSAVVLYPMNALVNDQVGRLDKWLKDQDRVSFFHFTSETPENARAANERDLPPATAAHFRTRQQARGWEDHRGEQIEDGSGPQPQILVTNYSMLEYMLCRPQDSVFFGENLRVIVLDEAHIYTGNLAAEITLLLRRVQMRCRRTPEQVLHIATSATIGGGAQELRPFASALFSKSTSLVQVIEGQRFCPPLSVDAAVETLPQSLADLLRTRPLPDENTIINTDGVPRWCEASDEARSRWRELLPCLAPSSVVEQAMNQNCPTAAMLFTVLRDSPAIAKLQAILWNEGRVLRLPLAELSERLFGTADEIEATRALLQLGAIARETPAGWPLVPNRLHYLMRGPEGLLISFQDNPQGRALKQMGGNRSVFSAGADPAHCGGDDDHPLTLFRCSVSGWWGVAGRQAGGLLNPVPASMVLHGIHQDEASLADDETPAAATAGRVKFYSLEEIDGATRIFFDPRTGRYSGSSGIPLWELPLDPQNRTQACPRSGAQLTKGNVGWFSARARLQLSVVAETALAIMPEFPNANNVWKPARGRRLLVFSDSRAEAARLGPRLTRQHEMQVFRASVISVLEQVDIGGDDQDLDAAREDAERLRTQLTRTDLSAARRHTLQRQLTQVEEDLAGSSEGGTVAQWAGHLRESTILNELFHTQSGERHSSRDERLADRWQQNGDSIKASAASLLGRELARRPSWPQTGLETLGLVEVVYPRLRELRAPAWLGTLPINANLIEQAWTNFIAALLDALRNQGCITLGSRVDDEDYQYGGMVIGKHFACRESFRRSLLPLIGVEFDGPQTSRRNAFARDVLIAAGLPREAAVTSAPEMMRLAFDALVEGARTGVLNWLEIDDQAQTNGDQPTTALRMKFPLLGLRRPSELHRCRVTGQVWPRSVLGLYPGARGRTLELLSPGLLDADARLGRRRRELREWEGFRLGLWAEEHSAQLSPAENARLQDLFREGMRNILSSTTTLELGIDIGGLSAVLMGNLPPGKANYLQRAGRAGRRADGSSAVLCFARPTPYEREVFLDFRRYLERELRRPTVFLDRAAIARRHTHAWLLGEFFQSHWHSHAYAGAMTAYGKMGPFAGMPEPLYWRNDTKPELPDADTRSLADQFVTFLGTIASSTTLLENLRRLWSQCPELEAILNLSPAACTSVIADIRGSFTTAVNDWRADVQLLTDAWREVPTIPPPGTSLSALKAQANAIYFQLRTLHQLTVIESLADSRVLPRYGFPIGVSRLRVQVIERDERTGRYQLRQEDQFRLERDSMMALREYAPGSQLLVGGKIITSRGLLKHWTGAVVASESWGLRGRFKRTNRGHFDYSVTSEAPAMPPQTAPGEQVFEGFLIFPKTGFCTAANDPPRHGSDFERVGQVEPYTLAFGIPSECDSPLIGFGGIPGCVATYRHGGELLVVNGGDKGLGFAICQKCGYAESEWRGNQQGRVNLPKGFEWHTPLNSTGRGGQPRFCWSNDEAPAWRSHHLAARQTTHLLKLDFASCGQALTEALLATLGQALRLAAAEVLELDSREIMSLKPVHDAQTGALSSVILYESLAGGAGHLAELSHRDYCERAREWIDQTIALLTVPEVYPLAVREREAMRRVLTADCIEENLIPLAALDFLVRARSNPATLPTVSAAPPPVPEDAWTLTRLLDNEPADVFSLFYPVDDITGVRAGVHICQRVNAKPANNTVVIIRDARLNERIAVGRWFCTRQDEGHWRVRLRKSSGESPWFILSNTEYDNFAPFAVLTPID